MLNRLVKLYFHQSPADRSVVMSALATPVSCLMAFLKLALGLFYFSAWLLGFGVFYLLLAAAKLWLLNRYRDTRKQRFNSENFQHVERTEVLVSGSLLIAMGIIFGLFCVYMVLHGYTQHFSDNTTYLIATIGFTKLISAIVSVVRSRKFHRPVIILLKAFSLADGLVAIVLTQYAILSMEGSKTVNLSTGYFGFGVSLILIIMAICLIIIALRRIKKIA